MNWTAVTLTVALVAWLSPVSAQGTLAPRPSNFAACGAWNAHVQNLVDQHRLTPEISDSAFDSALRLFAEARDACMAGRFKDAFHLYSIIPLSRPQQTSLR